MIDEAFRAACCALECWVLIPGRILRKTVHAWNS